MVCLFGLEKMVRGLENHQAGKKERRDQLPSISVAHVNPLKKKDEGNKSLGRKWRVVPDSNELRELIA